MKDLLSSNETEHVLSTATECYKKERKKEINQFLNIMGILAPLFEHCGEVKIIYLAI